MNSHDYNNERRNHAGDSRDGLPAPVLEGGQNMTWPIVVSKQTCDVARSLRRNGVEVHGMTDDVDGWKLK